MSNLERCPGVFCGRSLLQNNSWSDCGVCPRGSRVNESFACDYCVNDLNLYSWMYLGFMVGIFRWCQSVCHNNFIKLIWIGCAASNAALFLYWLGCQGQKVLTQATHTDQLCVYGDFTIGSAVDFAYGADVAAALVFLWSKTFHWLLYVVLQSKSELWGTLALHAGSCLSIVNLHDREKVAQVRIFNESAIFLNIVWN